MRYWVNNPFTPLQWTGWILVFCGGWDSLKQVLWEARMVFCERSCLLVGVLGSSLVPDFCIFLSHSSLTNSSTGCRIPLLSPNTWIPDSLRLSSNFSLRLEASQRMAQRGLWEHCVGCQYHSGNFQQRI